MTAAEFFDTIMPAIAPLPDRDRAVALAMCGREDVDEATADRVVEELRARFHGLLA
jgi:hypothetical protein